MVLRKHSYDAVKVAVVALAVLVGSGAPLTKASAQHASELAALPNFEPIHAVYQEVMIAQAKLPPAANDRERLERMFDLDQVGRQFMTSFDFSNLPVEQQEPARVSAWAEIARYDRALQTQLKHMMPKSGWFTRSKYGAKGSLAALLIVQHAINDPDLMRLTLRRIKPLVKRGEVYGGQYALRYDRVAL